VTPLLFAFSFTKNLRHPLDRRLHGPRTGLDVVAKRRIPVRVGNITPTVHHIMHFVQRTRNKRIMNSERRRQNQWWDVVQCSCLIATLFSRVNALFIGRTIFFINRWRLNRGQPVFWRVRWQRLLKDVVSTTDVIYVSVRFEDGYEWWIRQNMRGNQHC